MAKRTKNKAKTSSKNKARAGNPVGGKTKAQLSPETLQKMSLACKRRWKQGVYDGLRKEATA